MKTIIFATQNQGKVREVREILNGYQILTMGDVGLDLEIDENGTSFTENAVIKAKAVYDALKLLPDRPMFSYVCADDSGLEIDYFDKKPGIYSSRWLGEDTTYDVKNAIVLKDMEGVPEEKRTARYVCAIAAIDEDGQVQTVLETAEGLIGHAPSGNGGFGYDPIFVFPGMGSFADLTPDQKNAVSHRGKALRSMFALLESDSQN